MSDFALKLQILARAEMALAQIHVQRAAGRSALFVVAMVFTLVGLGMLDIAAFYAMSPGFGPALAALFVALINIAAAGVVLLAARKAGPKENEEKLAREMRNLAYTEIDRDVEQVRAEIEKIAADVEKIRSSFASFSSAVSSTLTPLLALLGKTVKKL